MFIAIKVNSRIVRSFRTDNMSRAGFLVAGFRLYFPPFFPLETTSCILVLLWFAVVGTVLNKRLIGLRSRK